MSLVYIVFHKCVNKCYLSVEKCQIFSDLSEHNIKRASCQQYIASLLQTVIQTQTKFQFIKCTQLLDNLNWFVI